MFAPLHKFAHVDSWQTPYHVTLSVEQQQHTPVAENHDDASGLGRLGQVLHGSCMVDKSKVV